MFSRCFFFGGINRIDQKFNVMVAQTSASLLALAVGSLLIPTAFHDFSNAGSRGIAPLSRGTSVILLVTYASYLFFQLKTHTHIFAEESEKTPKRRTKVEEGDTTKSIARTLLSIPENRNRSSLTIAEIGANMSSTMANPGDQQISIEEPEEKEEPQLHIWVAIATLGISTAFVALCAEFMVDSINAITAEGGISKTFVGLILLPIVGNAAEHATAVTVAVKDKMDLAIGVAVGSSLQIALLVIPFAVILGWIMGKDDMTLYFDGFQIAILFVAVILVNYLIQDG